MSTLYGVSSIKSVGVGYRIWDSRNQYAQPSARLIILEKEPANWSLFTKWHLKSFCSIIYLLWSQFQFIIVIRF